LGYDVARHLDARAMILADFIARLDDHVDRMRGIRRKCESARGSIQVIQEDA
jgi:hypothetical protein